MAAALRLRPLWEATSQAQPTSCCAPTPAVIKRHGARVHHAAFNSAPARRDAVSRHGELSSQLVAGLLSETHAPGVSVQCLFLTRWVCASRGSVSASHFEKALENVTPARVVVQ